MIEVNDKIEVAYMRGARGSVVTGEFSNLGAAWLEIKNPTGDWVSAGSTLLLIPTGSIAEIEVLAKA